MTTFDDLKDFFKDQDYKVIIVGDAEPRTHKRHKGMLTTSSPAGGVSVALDSIALAANATYIARGKTPEDREVVGKNGKITIKSGEDSYTLKRLFFNDTDIDNYYFGFANQTLWPLSHVAFEPPQFRADWYEGYRKVNKAYATAIREEIKGKTLVMIQDYQLALVPTYLGHPKDTIISFFWHIPWPTWEMYRILPYKKDILWSLLSCDYLAFHRRYQAKNFLSSVTNELEARVNEETSSVYFDKHRLTVTSLPLGIDTDVIKKIAIPQDQDTYLIDFIRKALGVGGTEESIKSTKASSEGQKSEVRSQKPDPIDTFFEKYKVILGIDRLDYTKGLPQRLAALDRFLEKYPQYIGKVVYLGIMSPSREKIPSYQTLKKEVRRLEDAINKKYSTKNWKPLQMIYEFYSREDVVRLYRKAALCLVTPLDDGMNLVSKEFAVAASTSSDPGMLILSRFAGSAIDLSSALIINPYDIEEVADAIKKGLEMPRKERVERVKHMEKLLDEHNIYEWAKNFTKQSITSSKGEWER